MRRGELYLVHKPGHTDPRKQRVFVVVSRQLLIDSKFSTVICAPVYSRHDNLSTQIPVGIEQGFRTANRARVPTLTGHARRSGDRDHNR